MPDKKLVGELIQKSANSKGKINKLLGDVKRAGGDIKIIERNSALGGSIEKLGVKLDDFKSIDELRIELGADSKKVTKENLEEAKKEEEKREKEDEKKKKDFQKSKKEKKDDGKNLSKEEKEAVAKEKVKEKVKNLSKNVNENLEGSEKLGGVLEEEIEKIVRNKEIRTKEEIENELSEKIAKNLGSEINDKIKVESRRIVKESTKWEEKNIETVRDYRKASFKEEFEEEFKSLNPKASEKEISSAKEEAQLVADVYYADKGIENNREAILAAAVAVGVSGGRLENAYSNLEGMLGIMQKSPADFKNILTTYNTLSATVKTPPINLREFRAFDNMMGALGGGSEMLENFNSAQNKFLGLGNNFGGGGILGSARTFISSFGSQDVVSFAGNSIGIFANKGLGFQQGLSTIIQGFVSGSGVKSAIGSGIKSMVGRSLNKRLGGLVKGLMSKLAKGGMKKLMSGMMSKLGGGWGALINKGIEVLKKVGKGLSKGLAKMFGMSDMNPKTRKWILIGILIATPFLGGMAQNINMASTMVPPVKKGNNYDVIIDGNFEIPICEPGIHTREIIKDIALSIEHKVEYNLASSWYRSDRQVGPVEKWGVPDGSGEPYGLDCAKFVSWVWNQCFIPFGIPQEGLGGSGVLISSGRNREGWEIIKANSVDELKVGDIFFRARTSPSRRNHVALYIGKDENGNPITIESTRDNNNPYRRGILKVENGTVKPNGGRTYTSIIRINVIPFADD